jgi:hypothetical protein
VKHLSRNFIYLNVYLIYTCSIKLDECDASVAGHVLGEPVETLVDTVASCGASCLNVPGSASESVEAELVSDLGGSHGAWKILLFSEDQ